MSPFELDEEMDGLESRMEETSRMAASFSSTLTQVRDSLGQTTRDLGDLKTGFAGGLRSAIDGLVIDGDRLSDALKGVGKTMIDTVYKAAMKPVTDQLGGLLSQGLNAAVSGAMPFANGAPFSQGRVMPFAKGVVVSQATPFPMRGGTGLMGEAGPEAIMPLARGPVRPGHDQCLHPRRRRLPPLPVPDRRRDVAPDVARRPQPLRCPHNLPRHPLPHIPQLRCPRWPRAAHRDRHPRQRP